MLTQTEAENRFLSRVARRLKFFESVSDCGLAIFLPSDEKQRTRAIERMVRMMARPNEFELISPARLKDATEAITAGLDNMQRNLPHDVQYRNRMFRMW
jgi:hypothetical protein